MRNLLLLATVLLFSSVMYGVVDYYPMTTIAEDFTATWCTYCPDAYSGLDLMHSQFDHTEFLSARFYNSSSGGEYATEETDARAVFYDVTAFPTVVFNGTKSIVGGGANVENGSSYLPIVSGNVFGASPIKVEIQAFDAATGLVTAKVTMKSLDENLQNVSLYLLLVENNVTNEITHLVRDVIQLNFSLTGQGNEYTAEQTFDISQVASATNCQAYVFVQKPDKTILNAASSIAMPAYKIRVATDQSRTFINDANTLLTGPEFTIFNLGQSQTINVSVVLDEVPGEGVNLNFCDDEFCYPGSSDFQMNSRATKTLHASLESPVEGMVKFHFEITSANMTEPIIVPFTFISRGTRVIIVDDDESNYEDFIKASCDSLNISSAIWNLADAKLTTEVASTFNTLLWSVGWNFPSLDATDRAYISSYLDSGEKNLFITGQDIGWDLCDSQSDNNDIEFYNNYLHANFLSDNVNNTSLTGEAGSIMDNLSIEIAGGDGANNQEYPSKISPNGANSVSIFKYGNNLGTGAIASTHNESSKVVYFAFGYEAINNVQSRNDVMARILDYFGVLVGNEDNTVIAEAKAGINKVYPNPFNPTTTIDLSIVKSGKVKVDIYNVRGQKVSTLLNGELSAGNHKLTWNGKNDLGNTVTSGVYFLKMQTGNQESVRKLLLMK